MLEHMRIKLALLIAPELRVDRAIFRSSCEHQGAGSEAEIRNILVLGHALAAHKGLALSSISLRAAGKGSFLPDMDRDRGRGDVNVSVRRLRKILTWFAANWPDDLEWPASIQRPDVIPARPGKESADA